MANQKDDLLLLMSLGIPNGIFLSDRQGALMFPTPHSSVPDYSYSQQRSQGQSGHGPSFLLHEQYTNSNDVGSSWHVCTNDQYLEILASRSSGATTGNEVAHGTRIEYHAISESGDNADPLSQQLTLQLEGQLSEQERAPLLHDSVVVNSSPNGQCSLDLLVITFADANNGLTSPLMPQNDTCYEGQTFDRQLEPGPRVVHAGHKKVHCTFPGCSKFIKKDGLIRHVNEVHLQVVKGVCTHCGRGFQRQYLKKKHELTCRS